MHAAAGHGFKSREWQYNMSVYPVVREPFAIFVFILISSVGSNAVMHLLSPRWVPIELIYLSLCLFVSLSLYLYARSSALLFGDYLRSPQLCVAHAAIGHGVKYP